MGKNLSVSYEGEHLGKIPLDYFYTSEPGAKKYLIFQGDNLVFSRHKREGELIATLESKACGIDHSGRMIWVKPSPQLPKVSTKNPGEDGSCNIGLNGRELPLRTTLIINLNGLELSLTED
jgi:hypothetical protein